MTDGHGKGKGGEERVAYRLYADPCLNIEKFMSGAYWSWKEHLAYFAEMNQTCYRR